ncbi:hypothetical protein MAR_017032 [Mya arenaria]|uniref:Uncharacterized protein n=1 Tax=Mya arenaria TaxID=6604 RepID=A0ABY7ED94_MYAAR|nr:uncharacterized protein LOC128236531 [Mya arenaria]WAR07037.1 hypothetical protein MAR_016995 [Mya arenaria]WAR07074.1 hypothetical protein MAR_017032 [Mya arenaria]
MSVKPARPGADTDVDRYIRESVKSFKDCNVKNNARRNSLQRRTLGIECERRLASASLSREERQLRQHLRQMNIEKAKNHIIHNLRDTKSGHRKVSKEERAVPHELPIPVEPYPVTFRPDTPSPTELDRRIHGRAYAARSHRRRSREFEDLNLNTGNNGSLFQIPEVSHEDEGPRRRVNSMSTAQRVLSRKHYSSSGSSSTAGTPRGSPKTRKKSLGQKKRATSNNSSKESVDEGSDQITSLSELHWIGDPEAIHSVRRPRLTVDEQELEAEIHKLTLT